MVRSRTWFSFSWLAPLAVCVVLLCESAVEAEAPPPMAAEDEAQPRFWGALLLGPRFDVGLGSGWSRFGLGAGLSPELSIGRLRFGLGLGLDAYPSLHVRVNSSDANLSEVSPRLFTGVSWFTPGVSLTFQTGPEWNVMSVRGRTPSGFESSHTVSGLSWSFALGAERAFAPSFALGARLELHVAERRLHFDVNDKSVLDRGRLRLTLGIDLTFRTSIVPVR